MLWPLIAAITLVLHLSSANRLQAAFLRPWAAARAGSPASVHLRLKPMRERIRVERPMLEAVFSERTGLYTQLLRAAS